MRILRVRASPGDADVQEGAPSDTGVRRVTDPEECVALVTGAFRDDVAGGSREWTFFLAAVDASARANRLTLHVGESSAGVSGVSIVIHGSQTSSVWKSISSSRKGHDQLFFGSVMAEATERGVTQVIWPGKWSSLGLHSAPMSDMKSGTGHHQLRHLIRR